MSCTICGKPSYADVCYNCRTEKKASVERPRPKCSINGCGCVANITPHAHIPSHIIPELTNRDNRYCIAHYYMAVIDEQKYYANLRSGVNYKDEFYKKLNKLSYEPVITTDPDIKEVF